LNAVTVFATIFVRRGRQVEAADDGMHAVDPAAFWA